MKEEKAMEIMKIGILSIAGVLLAVHFKQVKPEYGILIGLVCCLVIFSYAASMLTVLAGQITGIRSLVQGEEKYFSILFKVIGITYLCEFCAGICKDAGFGGLAGQIEIFGKLSVLLAGMPVLLSVIDTIRQFMG